MLPWQANIGRAHLISSLDLSPDSHVSKLPLWELCMEYDSCKRWTLSFAHSSTDCSQIWASTTCWICDWRKLCHNKGCTAHTKFGLHVFWTQTCKHWFIKELTKVWNHDLYGSKNQESQVIWHCKGSWWPVVHCWKFLCWSFSHISVSDNPSLYSQAVGWDRISFQTRGGQVQVYHVIFCHEQ
jgi:hypothetical protein